MLTVAKLVEMYSASDAAAAAGDRAGAERFHGQAMTEIERATWGPIGDTGAAMKALDLAAFLAVGAEFKAALDAARAADGVERLKGLRIALACDVDPCDDIPAALARRALAALACPVLIAG